MGFLLRDEGANHHHMTHHMKNFMTYSGNGLPHSARYRCLHWLYSCGLTVMLTALASAAPDKTALLLDANNRALPAWKGAQVYEFPANQVTAPQGMRSVFFGQQIRLGFTNLPVNQTCRIRASFLSENNRILLIGANGITLEEGFCPEVGKITTREWIVPGQYLSKGTLTFSVYAMAGHNAVLQKLEILTEDGRPLQVCTGKDIPNFTQQDLENLVLPQPKVTPIPAAIEGIQTTTISLNGTWDFSASGRGDDFKPIQVPGEWVMQGFEVAPFQQALYRKTFTIPADWKGQQIKIRFDAVHSKCDVYLNGKKVGTHTGGMVPFVLDMTDQVLPGNNTLEVRVQSESISDFASCLSFYAAHRVGGILRKVTVYPVPETSLNDESVRYDVVPESGRATIFYDAEFAHSGSHSTQAELTAILRDPQGKIVQKQTRTVVVEPGKDVKAPMRFDLNQAQLWTSETPALYTLERSVLVDGRKIQAKPLRLGIREVEIRGNEMIINGKPVKLHGINRHEVHPLTGRSITRELCRQDAQMYKDAGLNLIRTSHYPPSEEFLEACDEIGLFVECESALCWVGQNQIWHGQFDVFDPIFFRYAHIANMDQIAAYKNHPSIVIWSMGNESNWNPWWVQVLKSDKAMDTTRPYTFHCQTMKGKLLGEVGLGIANQHYPSEHNPDEWSSHNEPLWFGEYAHLQAYNRRELATDPSIHEDWSRPLERMVDLMWKQKGCLGGALWCGIDDIFIMKDGSERGYGSWGPIDGWRREKPEYHGMRMAYTPFRVFSSGLNAEGQLELDVQNRLNFLNFNQLSIEWTCQGKKGTLQADLAPHARGKVVFKEVLPAGAQVDIVLKDPQGKQLARHIVTVPGDKNKAKVPADYVQNLAKPQIDNQKQTISTSIIPDLSLPVPLVQSVNGEGGTQLLGQIIKPLTDIGEWTWKPAGTQGEAISFTGQGAEGTGKLTLTPEDNGLVRVSYEVTVSRDVNPRQWGLVFTLPGKFDTIDWDRQPHWSWYPDNHIGRPQGTAKVNANAATKPTGQPTGPANKYWKDDSNELGSNDFRGTKMHINSCRMKAADGSSVIILPVANDKSQSVRAWKDGNNMRLFVSGFVIGGSDRFFWIHYQDEYKKLKKGDVIRSEFLIGFKK